MSIFTMNLRLLVFNINEWIVYVIEYWKHRLFILELHINIILLSYIFLIIIEFFINTVFEIIYNCLRCLQIWKFSYIILFLCNSLRLLRINFILVVIVFDTELIYLRLMVILIKLLIYKCMYDFLLKFFITVRPA